MLRKITEVWPNLLRTIRPDESDTEQPLLDRDESGPHNEKSQAIDEAQLNLDYRHLFWTRLMTIENYEIDLDRKFPMAPDIIEECRAVTDMEAVC